MGPTHGVHPMAKVSPTAKDPMKPAGLLRMWSCRVRPRTPHWRRPAMYRPKSTMRIPPPIRIQSRYSRKNWPAALKDAPRLTKTAVKPAMKAGEWSRIRDRSDTETSEASRSTDIPVTNERYDGKSGSTHGERNEKSPAENATSTPSDSAMGPAIL